MSVNGLDKITGRILAEANAEAEDILSRAREECAQISADYASRADGIRERLTAKASADAEALIAQTRADAAARERSLLLRQHVMPFLTWHQSASRDHNAFAPWKARMPPADALPELHIARKLGGPFDNKTLHAMQKNMDNPHYWQRYDAAQQALLRGFFGDYRIEGAALRAARGLLDVARSGVFAPAGQEETA